MHRNIPLLLFLALFSCAAESGVSAMGFLFHSKEVYTRFEAGAGYTVGNRTYGAARYTLYRKAKGIAAFPDGGRSRTVFDRVFLYAVPVGENVPILIHTVSGAPEPGVNVTYCRFAVRGNTLLLMYKARRGAVAEPGSFRAFLLDMEGGGVREAETGELTELCATLWREGIFGVVEPVPEYGNPTGWELPSPLRFCEKSDRAYGDDLVMLRGDLAYRRAVIEAVRAGEVRLDPVRILERIEKRKEKLDGYKRSEYIFLARETEEALRALAGASP